jgi:hypothetical protein
MKLLASKVSIGLTATLTSILFNTIPAGAFQINSIATDTTGVKDIINELQQFVQQERIELANPDLKALDPTSLILSADSSPNVFFVNEGASKRNQLVFMASSGSNIQSGVIFPDISCKSGCPISEPNNGSLNIGDYVELGKFTAGTVFKFQLLSKNFNDGVTDVYGADPAYNSDGLAHLVAYSYKGGVLLGFEDLFGAKNATGGRNEAADRDFNDQVFYISPMPVKIKDDSNSQPVPEPATILGTLVGLGFMGTAAKKRKCQEQQKLEGAKLS